MEENQMKRNPTELEFQQWMDAQERFCVPSSDFANIYLHYDYVTDEGKVEVKDRKKIYRHDPDFCDWRKLIEWQAVHSPSGECGRIGWVRGSADWIVFREADGWLWVRRSALETLVSQVDWAVFSTRRDYDADFKAFRRHEEMDDRDDLFCYVPRASLLGLEGTKLFA
jgi:hypothetical protein